MIERIPMETPRGAVLRQMRERLGLSQSELARELGFTLHNGADTVRNWENEIEINGRLFVPTPLAWRAFRMIYVVSLALEMASRLERNPSGALEFLRTNTPEAFL